MVIAISRLYGPPLEEEPYIKKDIEKCPKIYDFLKLIAV